MVAAKAYCPNRGDLIWIDFDPQSGNEIMKRRPALVLSPKAYNQIAGLCVLCPISSQLKGHDFEIAVTIKGKKGVVKSDQVKSLDWRSRNAQKIATAPETVLTKTLFNLEALLFSEA